jgi:hypothetical protein
MIPHTYQQCEQQLKAGLAQPGRARSSMSGWYGLKRMPLPSIRYRLSWSN